MMRRDHLRSELSYKNGLNVAPPKVYPHWESKSLPGLPHIIITVNHLQIMESYYNFVLTVAEDSSEPTIPFFPFNALMN